MPLLEILNEYGFATMAAIAMGWLFGLSIRLLHKKSQRN